MVKKVHVFTGTFANRDAACRYTEPQWEPEPNDSASNEQYVAWENRNPIWPLRTDLGIYLDGDLIETIAGDDRYDYLQKMLLDAAVIDGIKKMAGSDANVLVLIFDEAIGGLESNIKPTSTLKYCGHFDCNLMGDE